MTNEQQSDQGEKLYQILVSQYSIVRERNDALVTRSQNLLGFAGIIDSISVAFIITLVSDEKVRDLLRSSSNLECFYLTITVSFLGYILSIILALAAFRVTKYMPVPQINSIDFIKKVFQNEANLSQKHLSMQIFKAIEFYDKKNAEKYMFLYWSTICLVIAIISTAILGALILKLIY